MIRLIRSSMAWRVAIALTLIALFAVFDRGTPWLGEWNWTTDWLSGASLLLGPLIAGCAAFDVVTMYRPAVTNLLHSTPRGLIWPFLCWLSNTAVVVALQLIIVAGGLVANLIVGAGGRPGFNFLISVVLDLGAAAAVGVLLGVIISGLAAVPAAVVLVFGASLLAANGMIPHIFRPGGVTGSMVGLSWNLSATAATSIFYLGLICASLLAVSLIRRHVRSVHLLTGIGASAALIIGSFLVLDTSIDDRIVVDTAPQEYVCDGEGPEVCLAVNTSRSLPSLRDALERGGAELEAAGVAIPPRYAQVIPGEEPANDSAPLFIESSSLNSPSVALTDAINYLINPTYCPDAVNAATAPPQDYFDSRTLMSQWLSVRMGELRPESLPNGPERRWLLLDGPSQEAWVRATYQKFADCRYGEARKPF